MNAWYVNGLTSQTCLQRLLRLFKITLRILTLVFYMASIAPVANAAIEVYEFETPQQEAQYRGLIAEFRCPKCQNQNLAGSDSQIAQDLKRKTYEMVIAGQTDAQIREYMYKRYGDFISYKPPVRPSTWILWYFPPLILLMLVAGWLWRTNARNKIRHNQQSVSPDPKSNAHVNEDLDKVGANLSSEEAATLKNLLDKHNSGK